MVTRMENVNKVVLCVGSNREPRISNVEKGLRQLNILLNNTEQSLIYETPEIHGIGTPYANAVIEGETTYSQVELNRLLKNLELKAGRDSEARSRGEVPLDIDIVIWNGDVVREKDFRHSFFQIGFRNLRQKAEDLININNRVKNRFNSNE